MTYTRVKETYATHTYIFEANEGEQLTNEVIAKHLNADNLAPFGFYVVYNFGGKAEVKAYVD